MKNAPEIIYIKQGLCNRKRKDLKQEVFFFVREAITGAFMLFGSAAILAMFYMLREVL